ncbi:PAS domain-containing protein [Roseospira marina]|uniref:PAS domain-containing protein n=1 Tax=Roseospira marina TaxID=140057 RepID=UPI0014794517|nr:PAS domain-containing protein [Roseospira marina]MBB4315949.1 PAS domain-containing protein [Roseospira marina]MBB5089090.1 PAS domain-containing protein [Roseospira marina]
MTPHPRIAARLVLFHGGIIVVCVALAVVLLVQQEWAARERHALLDEALPRFSDMLEVSRLGDALAETAGALAAATSEADRATALSAIAHARAALLDRIAALGTRRLEPATRDRLSTAADDLAAALDTLDALVGRRLALAGTTAELNAKLSRIGDLLPALERGLLTGEAPDRLDGVVDMERLEFPTGPSGEAAAAVAVRTWARNAQVAVGMMLAASGAASTDELDYLRIRTEEALRRSAGAIRAADRGARPLMEAIQGALTDISVSRDGSDGVIRARRQHLTLNQNTPAVLARGRQASDRLTAAVSQIIADVQQARAVQVAQRARTHPMWRLGIGLLAGLGVVLALLSFLFLWRAVVRRSRRLGRAALAARDDTPVRLPDRDLWPDELGVVAHAVEALDAERRRLAAARRDQGRRLSVLFAGLPDAVLLLTADRQVDDANPAAARLFERPVTHLLAKPLGTLLPDAPEVAAAVDRALKAPGTIGEPVTARVPDPAGGAASADRTVVVSVTAAFAAPSGAAAAGTDDEPDDDGPAAGPLVVVVLRSGPRPDAIPEDAAAESHGDPDGDPRGDPEGDTGDGSEDDGGEDGAATPDARPPAQGDRAASEGARPHVS